MLFYVTKLTIAIMKVIKITIFFLLYISNCAAQSGVDQSATINIQSMYAKGKQVFKKGKTAMSTNIIHLENKLGETDVWTGTVSKLEESFDHFIYKKDTMRVKMLLPSYYRLAGIKIRELNFIKGSYTINLLKLIEKADNIQNGFLIINNFPDDCLGI